MNALMLRVLLAVGLPPLLLWLAFEHLWIPFQYDRETAAIARELALRGEALQDRFSQLPEGEWPAAVTEYNRSSEDLLELLEVSDPRWTDRYARLRSDGETGILADGFDSTVSVLLPGEQHMLVNHRLYFDDDSFAADFWLFFLAAILVAAAAGALALDPLRRRFRQLASRALALQRGRDDRELGDPLARLDESLAGLERNLEATTAELEQSLASQRDLLHAVAHEFRSPIARLRFAHDMLEEADPPERQDLLRRIDGAIEELDDLVREVLGYSRIRHGGYRLALETVPLQATVDTVLGKIRAVYPGITIETEGSPEIEVRVDARLLERAVINLVRNAARFARSRVRIRWSLEGAVFQLRVEDDGPGIAPGKRERIFEPFTRLDPSRARDSGGSGLGLAIVRAISTQHEGTVSAHDSELGGALLELRWPTAPA